jgi:murein DD-endopeptidase MepM/ murein hydrolase activator NlpD
MPRPFVIRDHLSSAVVLSIVIGVLAVVSPVGADDEIDGLREQREELAREAAAVAGEIDRLGADDQAVFDALADIDAYIELQQNRIEAAEIAIAAAEADAVAARHEAELIGVEMEDIRERMRQRAIDAFIEPRDEIVSQLASDNLTETAIKRFLLDTVVGSEIDSVDAFREAESRRETARREALAAADSAEAERGRQAERLTELETARLEAEAIREEIQRRIDEWEGVGAEIDAADRAIEREIREIEEERRRAEEAARRATAEAARRQTEEAARRAAEASGADLPDIDFGDFVLTQWPTSGAITSVFGPRVHPIFGSVRNHSGLDIDGDTGDPIVAALAGVVITSGARSGYGNTVVVSHGGGFSTLYAHMSSIAVSAGQDVSSGSLLGAVGSTGWSTGPHLHFEVRFNAVAVNPLPFLP